MNLFNQVKMINIYEFITLIIFLFFIYTIFSTHPTIIRIGIYFSIFLLLKWIFNYRNCTFGYYECKLRNVKKDKGYINNYCEYFGDLIYSEYNYLIFILFMLVYLINLIKFFKLTYIYI